ncbi:MAG: DegV family protein [Mycoplasmatales bacterium]
MSTGIIVMSTTVKSKFVHEHIDLIAKTIDLSCNFKDGSEYTSTNINNSELFKLIDEKKEIPKTSQPSIQYMEDSIKEALNKFDNLVIISPHSSLSGTYQNCISCVDNLNANDKITIIEAQGIAATEMAVCDELVRLIKEGLSYQDISKSIIEFNKRAYILVFPQDIEYLKLSGRIKGAQALLLGVLNIKLAIEMRDHPPKLVSKGRGEKFILKYLNSVLDPNKVEYVCFASINADVKFKEQVFNFLDSKDIKYVDGGETDMTLAVHLGPNTIGFGVVEKQA